MWTVKQRNAVTVLLLSCLLLAGNTAGQGYSDALNPWQSLVQRAWDMFSYGAADDGKLSTRRRKSKSVCEDADYRKIALKLVREQPFAGLFRDTKGQTKFEGSGLVEFKGKYLAVFDSLEGLGYLDDKFEFRSSKNYIIGKLGGESQYEGVTVMTDTGRVIVLVEAREEQAVFKPVAIEVEISEDLQSYRQFRECVVDFEISHGNKGFEGVHYHWDGNQAYLLGLCEGNYCSGGRKGREAGNGVVVVSVLHQSEPNSTDCSWLPVKNIPIPRTANFIDYSEIAFRGNKVAITSQENSALFVGEFDFDALEFVGDGKVYYFPRDSHCDMVYCNVEGVEFIDDTRIIVTSDRAKAAQPYQCVPKDQSLHVFVLP